MQVSNNTLVQNSISGSGSASLAINSASNVNVSGGSISGAAGTAIKVYTDLSAGGDNRIENVSISGTNASFYDLDDSGVCDSGSCSLSLIDMPYIGNYTFGSDVPETIVVRNSEFGEVRFLSRVTGTGTNLTNDIRFGNNSVSVESGVNSGLNKTANITLYNIGN